MPWTPRYLLFLYRRQTDNYRKKTFQLTFIFYYTTLGHHNDARMNVALAMTAAYHGAAVANHCEVTDLIKNDDGIITGAKGKDVLTGDEWTVKAKV